MCTTRLTFLYPQLFRSVRLGESATQTAKTRCRKPSSHPSHRKQYATPFSTSAQLIQATFERHGKAVEPPPGPPGTIKLPQTNKEDASKSPQKTPGPEAQDKREAKKGDQERVVAQGEPEKSSDAAQETEKAGVDPSDPSQVSAAAWQARQRADQEASEEKMRQGGPMELVLHMPPPESDHHPHISFPRYVHHFDTYTLVKQLEKGGYTNAQAITVMKAVRGLLAQNLDVAQEGLVSKRDVDNETYLFNAACSELSSEVKNSRRHIDEAMRQQRTLLQHEVDILGQRMSQDLLTLKDDVKGMFNDRKMSVREEQRTMESAIQQINLKISVLLNSDAKSEIEGLRWTLVRRSVLGILFMAVLTLGTLRYTSYVSQQRQKEAEEHARRAEVRKRNAGKEDHAQSVDAAQILAAN